MSKDVYIRYSNCGANGKNANKSLEMRDTECRKEECEPKASASKTYNKTERQKDKEYFEIA